ncbi:ABC transporter ATP-binding protein [Alicyclobacillus shizuokensis]|uniref:ABC transporter ATP-binding protein n=1 Tax=Alicyclobacillus shizuokensis TaxID=392014 RepID=UPI000A5024D1|nr:ABC transporter ATP-binding protein [Alicyclobacillus shizuokensis]MCL6626927.1 ABC transporter ATP-binding protein [Alicyclobacillus shizuokensis]
MSVRVDLELAGLGLPPRLQAVSARWRGGQVIGVVGPNGAGKSTLLRLIAGVLPAATGTVSLSGRPLRGLASRERARWLAYLPQQLPEDCPFTVREFVEMGRYAHRSPWGGVGGHGWQVIHDSIARMGLGSYEDVPLSQLSGGERQRAGVARCLAQESPVLLLDEPISNLDVHYQLDMLQRLRELADAGRLVVVAIHHLEFAARYCSQLLLLDKGRVYACGRPQEVLTAAALRDVFGVEAEVFTDAHAHLRFTYLYPREGDAQRPSTAVQAGEEANR